MCKWAMTFSVMGSDGAMFYTKPDAIGSITSLHTCKDTKWHHIIYVRGIVEVTTVGRIIADHLIEFVDFLEMDLGVYKSEDLKDTSSSLC